MLDKVLNVIENYGLGGVLSRSWSYGWMQLSGLGPLGRTATWLATWFTPPHYERRRLASYNKHGYVAPSAVIYHENCHLGNHPFIADRVLIFQDKGDGTIKFSDRVFLYGDITLQTGEGGHLEIGSNTHIQPRCQFSCYKGPIQLGANIQVGVNCSFYSYNHQYEPDHLIQDQPLRTKGGIMIGDDAWLGCGVTVLDGVTIGKGAVIGAGSVVTQDIPAGAIAVGVPARVINRRDNWMVGSIS